MASFLERHGITVDRDRMAAMHRNYMESAPSKEMIIAGVEETLEVAASAAAIGTLEQRYGEEKTTLFMSDLLNVDGTPITKPEIGSDGKPTGKTVNVKKTGTGIPMSAAGAVVGLTAAALVPMTPGWRRRVLNVSTGLAAAWSYRKGIEWGQEWLDSKNKVADGSTGNESGVKNPGPPFTHSVQVTGEAGQLGEGASVVSLVDEANRILAQKRAAGGR